ncbi:MAG TPA: carboxylesterase family protein [Opitutaceae bacterium]|nr:carboxylesterase family protein [Opitutaceae bacterium]
MHPLTNRRTFIQSLGAYTAGLGATAALSPKLVGAEKISGATPAADDEAPILQIGDDIAVASTRAGKVRGFILNGVYTFHGIPYGADTSGDNRFQPPRPPAPWVGIMPTIWWGDSAPQNMEKRYANVYQSFIDHWNYEELSEDCLKLNIWTPALADKKKRPVIVWLHGGGFFAGNAIEQDGYHGENFARLGDAVFCSLNHRLGAIGFSNFAGVAGDAFRHSANVGMLDIVAALQWVKDNIASFGGDPDNVTIIGQSGGGAKVCTLMAMPAAKGLFHKAVALSGSSLRGVDKSYSEKLGAYIFAEAGLTSTSVEANAAALRTLQQLPWKEYLAIAERAERKLRSENPAPAGRRGGFSPVANGIDLPIDTFFSEADGLPHDVPLIVSTTFNETSPSRENSDYETITLAEVKEKLKPRFHDATDRVVDAYAKEFPNHKPVEIWSLVASNRQAAIATANAKSKQKAPVYACWFGWQPPLFDHRMRAFHCSDISFWFYNTDRMFTHTGGGARPRRLSTKMAQTLLHFMRTGSPNGGGLPDWPAYTSANGETMVLDDVSAVKNDPDRKARESLPPLS